jgi:hypothetical protein
MGYYYFDINDVAKQGIRGLLTSILAQLCVKSDPCHQIVSDPIFEKPSWIAAA